MVPTITLPDRLTPCGLDAVFSFRQLVIAKFASTAGRLWPEVRVRADISEDELWTHIRNLADARPLDAGILQEQHPIVHAWLYGERQA